MTLAEMLAAQGYRCFGYTANLNASSRFGFGQGFEDYQFCKSGGAPELREHALRILAEPQQQPFFLYVHYMEPHSPYAAPAAYRSLFVDPGYRGRIDGTHRQLNRIVSGEMKIDSEDGRRLEALYDQEIRYTDDEIGILLDALAAAGHDDDTIVVFIADHGEEFLDHGSVLHGYTLYQEQLHVPFFIHDPRRGQSRRIDDVTRHVDVLPTLLDLLGLAPADDIQGRSLVPRLDGSADEADVVETLAEVSLMAVKTVHQRSLRSGDWKLIDNIVPAGPVELYDLSSDPGEQVDLVTSDPATAQRLRVRLEELLASMPAAEGAETQLSEEEIRRLRSLGYVSTLR